MRMGAVPAAAELDRLDLDRVDLLDPELYAAGDPHAVWAALRRRAPLRRQQLPDGRAFWSVTRYQDACRVLGNSREFTSEGGSLLMQLGRGDAAAGRLLVATDPPRHTELRRPLTRLFSGRGLAAAEPGVRAAVRNLLRPGLNGAAWDLAERAVELPMAVAGALLGLPEPDWPQLSRWTAMAAAPDQPGLRVGTAPATLAIAHHQLFEYFAEQVRARAGAGADDLLGVLAATRDGPAPLTAEEMVLSCYSVLLGANATTPHTVAGTVAALVEHGWYGAARADRTLLPTLVEEGLRWTSAASSFLRHAVTDVRLAGGTARRGDAVAVWVGSANRDEDVFADPYRFDPRRADNRHIAFGYGPHYCLGAALARLTLRVFLEEVFAQFEEVEMAGPAEHLRSVFVAGLTHLPVRTRVGAPV